MKINVEFDLTPDEFRQALGLPDVEAFQQDLLQRIQKQMESGVEGYDPMSLMQPFLQQPLFQQGMANFGNYQQMMMDMLNRAASGAGQQGAAQGDESTASTSSGQSGSGSASASSRSRSKRSN
ncbi:hypothetical protein QWY79_11035 [Halomonas sabkhae]|uniref:Uncharacterized protein n=1 Tax=Halomonas halmophila TaxID=252 RepID=A0A4Y4EWD9_9GAMM|nr:MULTISPECIES: hypothetical protein [Halomonas]MDN3525795.1 hypothetical protein [Halomonas sabkhae]GED21436.1 hypothetical protein HHA01_04130 [Halomonas halmophila]